MANVTPLQAYLKRRAATPFEAPEPVHLDEHHIRCPLCEEPVDKRDLDIVARHLEPGHETPAYAPLVTQKVTQDPIKTYKFRAAFSPHPAKTCFFSRKFFRLPIKT